MKLISVEKIDYGKAIMTIDCGRGDVRTFRFINQEMADDLSEAIQLVLHRICISQRENTILDMSNEMRMLGAKSETIELCSEAAERKMLAHTLSD